ncbi:hypothetical protein LSAT2_029050, partial [Lamellibrachia satsuma]
RAYEPIAIDSTGVDYRNELSDPRLHFIGAPSVTSQVEIAIHKRVYRRRARHCHVGLSVSGGLARTAIVMFTERAVLPDGTVYELTQTWVPPPTASSVSDAHTH